jgi:N-acetylmuramoyl-L-alanine amidase
VIVIDPGHGGIDPGARHGGVHEADVMLALALELSAALGRIEGVQPAVTRLDDSFVPLQERLTLARGAGADLFISLHADALEGTQATGASVYTLTDDAAEEASQRMAERHDSRDLLAGVDLSGQSDDVALVLQDLARIESAASGDRFADQLVQAMADTGAPLNTRPRRQAPLAVLNAADFPSVLLEVGFLSNEVDRERLTSPQGRAQIVAAVTLAVGRWAIEEEALAPLIRQ